MEEANNNIIIDSDFDWESCKSSPPTKNPNKLLIPVNNLSFRDEDVAKFNKIYTDCIKREQEGFFPRKTNCFTQSQGISIRRDVLRGAFYAVTVKTSFIEIFIRNFNGRYYRFIIGYEKDKVKEKGMWGRKAFTIYKSELKKDGVLLENLSIENGFEVKQTIPKQKLDLFATPGRTYYNAHHCDLNSSYNAGMIESFPVLAKTVRRMYAMRKQHPIFKDVLNMTQGFMQSEMVGYRYSHISKSGYVFTDRKLEELSEKLKNNGYRVLGYNADGIWYQGEHPYEDETFGPDLGQWKTDHKYCKLRYKSKGCYEFENEEEGYHPVFRGESSYEKTVPRCNWVWGDIFKGEAVEFSFNEKCGLEKLCLY